MIAILKKEVSSYFNTVLGWIFIAVNLFFLGLYFTIYNVLYGSVYFSNTIGSCSFIVLITVPVLTMRVLAEERKNKTDQLLLTSPVSIGKIVLGKFLAMTVIFMIPVAISLVFPLVMRIFGTVPMGHAYASILGYVAYGLAAVSIGIFVSSITENQVISAVLSFGVLFILYMIGSIGSIIFSDGNVVKSLFDALDIGDRFNSFLQGTFDVRSLIFFISIIVFNLFLTTQSIQKRRWTISKKSIGTGAYSVSTILLAIAILVVTNICASQIPENYAAIDVTPNKLFSLSEETKEYLSKFDSEVVIYVYSSEDSYDVVVANTLERIASLSSKINVVYKDPAKYPNFGATYTSGNVSSGSIIVVGNGRSRIIDYDSLYETEFDYSTYTSNVVSYDAEGQIVSALVSLLSDNQPVVYIINGHNECVLDSTFTNAIEKANLTTADLSLLKVDAVPEDAGAVILFGPESNLSNDDISKLRAYADRGGKLFIVSNYAATSNDNLKSFLSEYGITLYDGIVSELGEGYYYQDPFLLLPEVADTTYLGGNSFYYVFAPYAQGFVADDNNEEYVVNPILTTTSSAIAKTDINNMTSYQAEDGDIEGLFIIGAQIQKTDGGEGAIYLFTAPNMFTQSANEMVSGANLQLFSSIMSTFNTEVESVSIPAKSYASDYNLVPQKYFVIVGILTVIILPLTLLVVGIVVWIKRRKR